MSVWDEQVIYARHVLALIRAGSPAPVHIADHNTPGDVAGWREDDRRLLIEEGRRQLDRQHEDLERIRGRAQVLLAVALALAGTTGSFLDDVRATDSELLWAIWILALLLGGWAALGAAATSVVRADMETIHASVLSRYQPPIEDKLAADYAIVVIAGENQVAGRLTNMRWSVSYLLVAALLTLVVWLTSDARRADSVATHPATAPALSRPAP